MLKLKSTLINPLYMFLRHQSSQTPPVIEGTGDMEQDWDLRARDNARFHIDSGHWRNRKEFASSGKTMLQSLILRGLELSPQSTVLEIGCGIGRLLKPLATRVREAHGVDVSAEMVRQGRSYLKGLNNVYLHKTSGTDLKGLPDSYFDFCFSYIVLQHVPRKSVVISYFQEAERVLKPGGILRFQVDGRTWDIARRDQAGTWSGVVFSEKEIVDALDRCNLEILEIFGQETQYFWVTARRRLQPGEVATPYIEFIAFPRPPRPYNSSSVRTFFHRLHPEKADDWSNQFLKGHLSLGYIARFFAERYRELKPEEYVHQVCTTFLDRLPETDEYKFYLSLLVGGNTDRLEVIDAIMGSEEFCDLLRVSTSRGGSVSRHEVQGVGKDS